MIKKYEVYNLTDMFRDRVNLRAGRFYLGWFGKVYEGTVESAKGLDRSLLNVIRGYLECWAVDGAKLEYGDVVKLDDIYYMLKGDVFYRIEMI